MKNHLTVPVVTAFLRPLMGKHDDYLKKCAEIILAILTARKLRISALAENMSGKYEANYRRVTRTLNELDNADEVLQRMLINEPDFFIGDPTIINRPDAKKTRYVGFVRPKRRGFYLLTIALPFKGRALPVAVHDYSPATFDSDGTSRNIEHGDAVAKIKELVGDKPIVWDREFSYGQFMADCEQENVKFIIRLNKSNHVRLTDVHGNEVELTIRNGERKTWQDLYYKGNIKVSVGAIWKTGFSKPLFIITNTSDADAAIDIYLQRMKIEQTFRDLKSYLGIDKNMSLKRENMHKLMVLALIGYIIASLLGEKLREEKCHQKKLHIAESTCFSFFFRNGNTWSIAS